MKTAIFVKITVKKNMSGKAVPATRMMLASAAHRTGRGLRGGR
jgi:hypothetical protein